MDDQYSSIVSEPADSTESDKITARKEFDQLAKESERLRSENLRDAVSKYMVWSVPFLWVLACVLVLVIAWHYIAPETCKWISQETLSTLTKFGLGSVVGFFASYARKRLE